MEAKDAIRIADAMLEDCKGVRVVIRYERSREDLEAENAKLRELVRDLYLCSDPCCDCPHHVFGEGYFCDLGMGWKLRRIRELGIEVD